MLRACAGRAMGQYGEPCSAVVLSDEDGLEMVRIDTGSDSTEMVDVVTLRYGAIGLFIAPAVSTNALAFANFPAVSPAESAISEGLCPSPEPARAERGSVSRDGAIFVDLRPESFRGSGPIGGICRAVSPHPSVMHQTQSTGEVWAVTSGDSAHAFREPLTESRRVMFRAQVSRLSLFSTNTAGRQKTRSGGGARRGLKVAPLPRPLIVARAQSRSMRAVRAAFDGAKRYWSRHNSYFPCGFSAYCST